jgi:hypothetical protein
MRENGAKVKKFLSDSRFFPIQPPSGSIGSLSRKQLRLLAARDGFPG